MFFLSQFPKFKELRPEQNLPPGPELKRRSPWTRSCLGVVHGNPLDVFFRIAAVRCKRSSMISVLKVNLCLWLFWKCPHGFFLVNLQNRVSILLALSNREFAVS